MKRTGFRGLALAVVVAGLVAGCSATPPDGGPVGAGTDPLGPSSPPLPTPGSPTSTATPDPTPTPDPRPTAATSEHPARNIPEPEMPAAAKKHTAAGLKAFTKYWFELVDYAYQTGKTKTLDALTSDGCGTCQRIINSTKFGHSGGKWISGGMVEISEPSTKFERNTDGAYNVFVEITQSAAIFHKATGVVSTELPRIGDGFVYQVIVLPVKEGWYVFGAGSPKGA